MKKKVRNLSNQVPKPEEKETQRKDTYTLTSVFPSEDIQKKAMKIIREKD